MGYADVPLGGSFEFDSDNWLAICIGCDFPSRDEWAGEEDGGPQENLDRDLEKLAHYLWLALDSCFNHRNYGDTQSTLTVKERLTELTGMLAGFKRSITHSQY